MSFELDEILAIAIPAGVAFAGLLVGVASGAPSIAACPSLEPTKEWEDWFVAMGYFKRANEFLDVNGDYETSGDPLYLLAASAAYGGGGGHFRSQDARDAVALRLLKKASLCGHPEALNLLASIYRKGQLGVAPNPGRAQCLRDLVDAGGSVADCDIRLDELYDFGPEALLSPTTVDPNDPCGMDSIAQLTGQCDDR